MKLRYAPTSPFVRKVMVTAIECGLDAKIRKVPTNVWDPHSDITDDNPLGKVPALITDDGQTLCDSPTICAYLDAQHDGPKLVPAGGAARWRVLNLAALAQGIMDAAVLRLTEIRARPSELRWDGWIERQKGKITRALDVLEREASEGGLEELDLATITIGCALSYLDFRFGDEDWRQGRAALAAWHAAFATRPSMQATVPREP